MLRICTSLPLLFCAVKSTLNLPPFHKPFAMQPHTHYSTPVILVWPIIVVSLWHRYVHVHVYQLLSDACIQLPYHTHMYCMIMIDTPCYQDCHVARSRHSTTIDREIFVLNFFVCRILCRSISMVLSTTKIFSGLLVSCV